MRFGSSIYVALAALVTLSAGCGRGKDPVLAEVGDESITASEYRDAYLAMNPADRPSLATLEEKRTFLQDLVSKQVMEHIALAKYPQLSEQQEWRLHRFREKDLSDSVKKRLIRNEATVTPAMKDWAYEAMKRERRLSAMVIVDADAAAYVRKQLDEGADFSALARDHSLQWVNDQGAGNLGWRQPGTFPYPVDRSIWDAEVGSTLGPLQSAMGHYIVRVEEERPAEVKGTRQELDGMLGERLMEQLYLDRQKAVQDSLRAAADPYYPAAGKAILNMKFFWEPSEDQVDNPFAALDADRVIPTFSAEEETVLAVDFKNGTDWTVKTFTEYLSWVPAGMWPRGQSEDQLVECMDLVLRDFLYVKAARDLGMEDEGFKKRVENAKRQMRVNYFYYNDIVSEFSPDQGEIDAYFQANRERYEAPESYKLSFFGSRTKDIIADLVVDWRAGMGFSELRSKYEKRDPDMLAIGETEWLYSQQDALRDEMVSGMKEGEVTDVILRNDVALCFRLIAKRSPRLLSYGEIQEQVDEEAKTAIVDEKLTTLLDGEAKKLGVKIHEKALAKVKVEVETPAAEGASVAAG